MQTVEFRFPADAYQGEIKTIAIVGTFMFYYSNLTGNTCQTGMMDNSEYFNPHQYRPEMSPIGMHYYEEMRRDASGDYVISFELPAGLYNYRFAINASIEEFIPELRSGRLAAILPDGRMAGLGADTVYMTDPNNPPRIPSVSGAQKDSVIAVGDWNDMPWLPGAPEDARGCVSYISYTDIDGAVHSLGIYLPHGYDRTKTYPAIFVSHGGGGNEADWFHLAGLGYNMDSLLARGETRDAIVITMNNSVYNWDFEKIAANMYKCVIPFVRALFPVSERVEDNAFCGLSMGSMTTLYLYMHYNSAFKYFGAFSGGIAGGKEFSLEDPALFDKKLLIGCAEEDIAWNERDIGVPPTIRQLHAKGLPFKEYFVPGSHDWYCWPQMFTEFARNFLWK